MSPSDTDAPAETRTFSDFGVHAALCEALDDAGITDPFPIQELTLPMALAGADVIGQARTGTGKTLAFGLPALQRLDTTQHHVQALVIVPTRELCLQVTDDLEKAGAKLDVSVVALYGGRPIPPQAQALADGAHVAVGTPGRLLDLHQRGILDLSHVGTLVLDEADEMLDLGFLPDVERLIEFCPTRRQTLLFSATMPSPVVKLARRYMSQPTFLRAEDDRSDLSPDTTHYFFSCHRLDKPALLARILQAPDRGLCVVFTRTKRMADQLATELNDRDVDAAAIHSDLRQEARERAMQRFRDGKISVLVATEVAARGLDIDDVTHVVNYDCPDDEKMYLHRIGRTGRAGAAGAAITLAVWNELARLEMIKKAIGLGEEPTHEVFSTSELVDELFGLPPRQSRSRSAGAAQADHGGADAGADRRGATPARSSDKSASTSGSGGGNQQRRRGKRGGRDRSSSGGRPAAASAAESSPETGPPDSASSKSSSPDSAPAQSTPRATTDEAGPRRTRQRTRTRTRSRATSDQGGERQRAPSRKPETGAGSSTDDGSARSSQEASGSGSPAGDDRRTESAPSGGDGGGTGKGRGQSGAAKRGGQSGAGKRGNQGGAAKRGGGKRGGQRRGGKQQSERSGPRQVVVSAGVARGEGRPQIRRPLQVQHLP